MVPRKFHGGEGPLTGHLSDGWGEEELIGQTNDVGSHIGEQSSLISGECFGSIQRHLRTALRHAA